MLCTQWFLRSVGAALYIVAIFVPTADADTRVGFAAFGSYNSYSMEDVNNAIGTVNAILSANGYPGRMDKISGGIGLGLGARVWPSNSARLDFDLERLNGRSKLSDATGSIELKVSANALTATASYFFPSGGTARFGLGLGLGYYISAASEEDRIAGVGNAEYQWSGSGFGAHGLAQAEVPISPIINLEANAGYRHAKVEFDIEGQDTNSDLDWSGFGSRIGLVIYFGNQ